MKKAFTMIELVFVIVVMGILAATILPSTRTNPLEEAAVQLLSHIRYTQHLAMVDDVFDADDSIWYKKRWQLVFSNAVNPNSTVAYTIFSDTATGVATSVAGDADISEVAINPQNRTKRLTGGYASAISSTHAQVTKKLNLQLSYGIDRVDFDDGCNGGLRLFFDNNGRPMKGDQDSMTGAYSAGTQRLITSACTIVLFSADNNISITVQPETGYANINF
jgi:prepilin-type N-terminal cleavage/methylation domain-containing protein